MECVIKSLAESVFYFNMDTRKQTTVVKMITGKKTDDWDVFIKCTLKETKELVSVLVKFALKQKLQHQ